MGKTFYYKDELNDDFANNGINTKTIPDGYDYFHDNKIRRCVSFAFYHFIATPIVFILQKTVYAERLVGRKKIKKYRKSGFFMFGNHTRAMGDAFSPSLIAFPKKAYIITHADAVSLPLLSRVVEDLGALPLPSSMAGMKNFCSAISTHAERNHVIAIYPEAHIWPYYTDIRPFKDTSFSYAIKAKKPVFAYTTTYKKKKILGGVKTVVYIDGPFFADENLSEKEARKDLRDKVYNTMVERSKLSSYSKNTYVKIDA